MRATWPYRARMTVVRIGSYRFFLYAGDREDPQHVHVERDSNVAKFWLAPVILQMSRGFSRRDVSVIRNLVENHRDTLARSWNEYFNR
jgi:hypothetical protein